MRKHILLQLLSLTILWSCNSTEKQQENLNFSPSLVQSLYSEFEQQFEIDFKESHLKTLLNNVNVQELKNGIEHEQEFLFEDFECECFDKMKISFSNESGRFNLWVYEEFYEADLDWCPESSYSYSFKIENNKIVDLKLDYMAG